MKTIATAAMQAIEEGTAIVTGAVAITPRSGGAILRFWGGHGPITFGGHAYKGLGDRALVQRTSNAIGGVAQGLTLTLSGIEPAALALLDPDEVKGASNVLYRMIFASDARTLLDAHVFDRGRGDALTTDEVIGGAAAINYAVESAARGLGRSSARLRSDPDQRLIDPNDGYFRNTDFAGEKMLYWAGKRPARTASAVASPPSGDPM
jgi:hypothetical protein